MRAEDIRGLELLSRDPATGLPVSGPLRIMIVALPCMASLINDLKSVVDTKQFDVILTRFGYEIGLCQAAFMSSQYDFESPEEWLQAGGEMLRLSGLANQTLTRLELDREAGRLNFEGRWDDSFEASMYLERLGKTDVPGCRVISGIASGYASAVLGEEVLVRETACQASGVDHCRFEGRSYRDWNLEAGEIQDYLSVQPVAPELERLRDQLRQASEALERERAKVERLRSARQGHGREGLVFRSDAMARVLDMAEKVAPTGSTVLIQGESGTGKEILARHIHNHSGRRDEPFLAVNCAALPPNLLESELFGHRKGAFTGADADKTGLFVEAGRGTIFLDEVGELPLELQAKLLRAIQEREVRPVGGVKDIPIEARIVAATNADLRRMVREGRFREDLYYRLSVFPLSVDPLRDRTGDILPLARHFLAAIKPDHPGFTPGAIRRMELYPWPGNVRELENWVEYATVLAGDEKIGPEHLPRDPSVGQDDPIRCLAEDLPPVDELERRYIRLVLGRTQGNKSETSRILGMSISTLWRRLKEMDE